MFTKKRGRFAKRATFAKRSETKWKDTKHKVLSIETGDLFAQKSNQVSTILRYIALRPHGAMQYWTTAPQYMSYCITALGNLYPVLTIPCIASMSPMTHCHTASLPDIWLLHGHIMDNPHTVLPTRAKAWCDYRGRKAKIDISASGKIWHHYLSLVTHRYQVVNSARGCKYTHCTYMCTISTHWCSNKRETRDLLYGSREYVEISKNFL